MPPSLAEMASPSTTSPRLAMTPKEVFEITRMREEALSRLLMAFITSGLTFMVFPVTFLGVWNLLQISGRESLKSISPNWLQAHGHAQVFGWVGSFILGIGFYSISKMRGGVKSSFATAWGCWAMWTTGAALRWAANVYLWRWRILLPFSAVLELAAFLIFFRNVRNIGLGAPANRSSTVDLGGDQREPRIVTRNQSGISRSIRPTFSRADGLGIPGSVCLGVQREVDGRVSRAAAAAVELAARGSSRKSDGPMPHSRRSKRNRGGSICSRTGIAIAAHVRIFQA